MFLSNFITSYYIATRNETTSKFIIDNIKLLWGNTYFQLAQLVVNTGGIAALIELVNVSKSATKLPAIMALGYIAGHSDQLAAAITGSKVRIEMNKKVSLNLRVM